jgi:hypothetical protein
VIKSLNYIVLWDENLVKEAPGAGQAVERATVAELAVADTMPGDDLLPQAYQRLNWQPFQVGLEGLSPRL